jgi:predicted HTH domain antitoxin
MPQGTYAHSSGWPRGSGGRSLVRVAVRAYFRNDARLVEACFAHLTDESVTLAEASRIAGMSPQGLRKHVRGLKSHLAHALREEGIGG